MITSDGLSQLLSSISLNHASNAVFEEELGLQRQSFTKYQVELHPSLLSIDQKIEVPGFSWYSLEELEKIVTFSSGHKRILKDLLKQVF